MSLDTHRDTRKASCQKCRWDIGFVAWRYCPMCASPLTIVQHCDTVGCGGPLTGPPKPVCRNKHLHAGVVVERHGGMS